MPVISLDIVLTQLYFTMNNVPSQWQQRHQKTLPTLIKLLTLIAVIGTLCYISDFQQARDSQSIFSKEGFIKNSRILKQQEQIREQKKLKTQTLQSSFKRQVFNLQNKDKIFGRDEKFGVRVDVEKFKQNSDYQLYKSNGIFDRIQVSSPYDYANLTKTINFTQVSRKMIQSISYELIEFQQTQQNQKLEQLTMKTLMEDQKQYDSIMAMANIKNGQLLRRAQYNLAIRFDQDPKSVLLREAEYLMYDIKYNLSSIVEQLPMCIYASGYKSYLKNVYSQFFESVNRLNYTNYHIVYVDDNSPSDNIEGILQFLQKSDFRFKNKIKIINNKQHLGGLGNLYIWINKYCNEGDIVIHADSDDWFIGSQVLKVLNAVYQDPQAWYVYSKYLKKTSKRGYTNGLSLELRIPVAQYRNTILWSTSHLRTFRKKLFVKIPLSYFTQYHLDETTSIAYPAFMSLAYDTDEVYSQLELCGDQRYKHITDYLYLYSGPGTTTYNSKGINCFRLHETEDQYKTRIKIPLKKLKSIEQPAEAVQNFVPLRRTLQMLGSNFRGYSKCSENDQKPQIVVEQKRKRRLKVHIIKSKKL